MLENEFVHVYPVPNTRIIRVYRTARPIVHVNEIADAWGAVELEVAGLDKSRHLLLIDMREARGRNDPDFERIVAKHRRAIRAGFRRVAVLVKTPAGAMQVRRHMREDGVATAEVFLHEGQAIAWLEAAEVGDRRSLGPVLRRDAPAALRTRT